MSRLTLSQHKGAPFKIAERVNWTVVVSSREHVEELLRATDEEFSFMEASDEVSYCSIFMGLACTEYLRQRVSTRSIFGDEVHDWQYHVAAIRNQLTRNLATLYPEIRDEIVTAFDELLDLTGKGEVFDSAVN